MYLGIPNKILYIIYDMVYYLLVATMVILRLYQIITGRLEEARHVLYPITVAHEIESATAPLTALFATLNFLRDTSQPPPTAHTAA